VYVGVLEVQIRLEGVRSLKEKRSFIRPLIERIRRDFQVSVAEIGDQDLWGNSEIGVAAASSSASHAESILQHVLEAFERDVPHSFEVLSKSILRT
jgi:uncharacterized protein YlxP (DUF503 family)